MLKKEFFFIRGAAFIALKQADFRISRCWKNFTVSRIDFLKKHKIRIDKRIEKLEASLPQNRKKKISKIQIQ